MSLQDAQEQVRSFMDQAGQSGPSKPEVPGTVTQTLRLSLHKEECVTELAEAFNKNDITLIADSIADSLVVVLGTAIACGIDIEPIFNEVMQSNMTKFIDGYRRDDGKWIKGPSYKPAQIAKLLLQQCTANPSSCASTVAPTK